MPVQVVEVRRAGRAVWPEIRNRQKPAHRQSGLPRVREPGVAWRVAVVVGAQHDAGLRMSVPNGPRHRREPRQTDVPVEMPHQFVDRLAIAEHAQGNGCLPQQSGSTQRVLQQLAQLRTGAAVPEQRQGDGHMAAHLVAFPYVDQRTRDNLASFIDWADA